LKNKGKLKIGKMMENYGVLEIYFYSVSYN